VDPSWAEPYDAQCLYDEQGLYDERTRVTSDVSAWHARYPDLVGKVAVVCGDDATTAAVVVALAASGVAIAVVAPTRETVDAAIRAADLHGVAIFGVSGDPAESATWARIGPHAEQRLGPIDIVIALGTDAAQDTVIAALLPDLVARHRGVVVEVGQRRPPSTTATGVRRRTVSPAGTTSAHDVAAAVVLCASDVLLSPIAEVRLGG
jgi:hypothetical protein